MSCQRDFLLTKTDPIFKASLNTHRLKSRRNPDPLSFCSFHTARDTLILLTPRPPRNVHYFQKDITNGTHLPNVVPHHMSDPILDALFLAVFNTEEHNPYRVVQLLSEWKSSFSLGWYLQSYSSSPSALGPVWLMLFQLVEFHDESVKVGAFNAIGAFLVALSPFHALELLESFASVLDGLAVSPNTSVAVLCSFFFLGRQVGPHKRRWMESRLRIVQHFTVDFTVFVENLPSIVQQMEGSSVEYHRALLNSLLQGEPIAASHYVVGAIVMLVAHYPDELLESLFLIDSPRRVALVLPLGSALVRNETLGKLLTAGQRRLLFALAKEEVSKPGLVGASETEAAIAVLRDILSHKESELNEEARMFCAGLEAPGEKVHLRRLFLNICLDFDRLRPLKTDSSADLVAKIHNFGHFSPEFDRDILAICGTFLDRRDEAFLAVLSLFSAHTSLISAHLTETVPMLKKILRARDYSWVSQTAAVALIGALNSFEIQPHYADYEKDAVAFLVESALSPQTSLAQEAREVSSRLIGLHNFEFFVDALLATDFFDTTVISPFLLFVESINADIRNAPRVFLPVIIELLRFWPDESFLSQGFLLMASIQGRVRLRHSDFQSCQRHFEQLYFAYTHVPLMGAEVLGSAPWVHTTDILSNPSLATLEILQPLEACFRFLSGSGSFFSPLPLALAVFPLLPKQCLKIFLAAELDAAQLQNLFPLVERVLDTSNSHDVLCLCCKFFLKYGITLRAKGTLLAILDLKSVIHPRFALEIVRCFWATDGNSTVDVALRMLEELPEPMAHHLSVLLWEITDQAQGHSLREELALRFPFLLIQARPEIAAEWFAGHAIGSWPVSYSSDFTAAIVRLVRESSQRIALKDLDSIKCRDWKFLITNQDFVAMKGVRTFLRRPSARYNLKRMALFATTFERSFTFSRPPPDSRATVTPWLRRGIIPDSKLLVAQALAFTSAQFSLKTIGAVVQAFPDLETAANRYCDRLKIRRLTPVSASDIIEAKAAFSIKKAFLRTMCTRSHEMDPTLIEMFRMFMIKRTGELGKENRWLYCLRLLRIALAMEGKKTLFRSNTMDNLEQILTAFGRASDYVTREMRLLVESLYGDEDFSPLLATFPDLRRVETFANVEVPSYFIELLRRPTPATLPDIMRQLDQNRREMLYTCFVDDAIIGMLIRDRSFITRPEEYLLIFLTDKYPLFERASPLFPILIARTQPLLRQIEPTVAELTEHCWSLPSALSILAFFYRTMLKGTEDAELREFEILQSIFLSAQTVENARPFAAALRTATSFCDLPTLLQKYMIGPEYRFFILLVVLAEFLSDWGDAERRMAVGLLVNRSAAVPKKSRRQAIRRFSKRELDQAFILALAETDDPNEMDSLIRGLV
jgi:hypothetical protein